MSTTDADGPIAEPQPSHGERRAVRATIVAFAAVAAVTVAGMAFATASARNPDPASPAETVRAFLITAVVDSDGVDSCRYLSRRATRQVLATQPPSTSCQTALAAPRLVLGQDVVDQQSTVKRLSYRVEQRGDSARVTVSADGAARTFALHIATAQERNGVQDAGHAVAPRLWSRCSNRAGVRGSPMTGVPTRILVAVTVPTGSEEAMVAAVALAAALGAELVLAGIAPLAPPDQSAGWPPNVSPLGEQVERQRLIDRLVGERLACRA